MVPVELPLSELALKCLPKVDGIVLSLFSRMPVVAALASFKATYELLECADAVQRHANLADFSDRAREFCQSRGGTSQGVSGDKFICTVTEAKR
jgi:hypothetical protein